MDETLAERVPTCADCRAPLRENVRGLNTCDTADCPGNLRMDTPEPAPVGDVETWYETPGDAEYPDVLHDDVPVRVDWWWTEEGRAKHLAAFAAAQRAEAWDEGHQTRQRRGPDDCTCSAWDAGECACGRFGTGPLISLAENPYCTEARP